MVGDDVDLTATVARRRKQAPVQFKDGGAERRRPVSPRGRRRERGSPGSSSRRAVTTTSPRPSSVPAGTTAPTPPATRRVDRQGRRLGYHHRRARAGHRDHRHAGATCPRPSVRSRPVMTWRRKVDGVEVGTVQVGTGDGVAILPHTFPPRHRQGRCGDQRL